MKEYLIISIKDNVLTYDYRNIDESLNKYINKNEFINNTLYFSMKYYSNNYEKVIDLIKRNYSGIDTMNVRHLVTFKYVVIMMIRLKMSYLKLDIPSTISLSDYELFLTVNTLKQIDCYFMPIFIKEKFNNKNVIVNLYNHNKISDRFMISQDSLDYETLYYRKTLEIKEEYPGILDDIKEFLRINYNLKSIHIYVFSKDLINNIINLVKNDESRNIIVFLHQGKDKGNFIVNNFAWLKELNKKCKKDYTCEFRILYSNDFIRNNLFKQLTFNNLKLMSIMAVYVSVVCLLIFKSYEYIEKMAIDEVNQEIINSSFALPNNDSKEELTNGGVELDQKLDDKQVKDKYSFDKVFPKLKKINKETVGYLVVNGTNINYPLVQHSDNSYYLKRDFYKKKTSMGWIYLDYRNDIENLNDNSIIYGHSMLNGTMFGTLYRVINSSFRKNNENMIISLDTPTKSYKFKIFSAYRVDYTTDYLVNNFNSKEEFDSFVKLIKGRSSFKTKDKVEYGDKILTLSTCAGGGNRRMVVHAVLIKDGE